MIDSDVSAFYVAFALVCVGLCVSYIRAKSLETTVITTEEFQRFQSVFLAGYALVIFGELLASASFFHVILSLSMTIEQATRLYVTTIVSSSVGNTLLEMADIGSRRNKCLLCGVFYAVSMLIMFSGSHYEMLMVGRILYGLASALQHSCFESFAVHAHSSHGFPDDWLTETFTKLTHFMALVGAATGIIGQTFGEMSARSCVLLSVIAFFIAIVIMALWEKDVHTPRFTMQGFLFHVQQSVNAIRSNTQLACLLGVSTLCEASIIVFSFYWAPWLAGLQGDESKESRVPFELVFGTFACSSLLGNYLFQVLLASFGASVESTLQSSVVVSSAAFFLSAIFQTSFFALIASLLIQIAIGIYWPAIGHFRARLIVPELRNTILLLGKIAAVVCSVLVLLSIHDSSTMILFSCSAFMGCAAYVQMNHMDKSLLVSDFDEDNASDDDDVL